MVVQLCQEPCIILVKGIIEKASDTRHSVYTLMHEGQKFLITFEGRETLPPRDNPLVIIVKVTY